MKKRKKSTPPIARVVWTDAAMSADAHWAAGRKPDKPKVKAHACVSVGWVTHCDEHFIQLTQTLTNGQHAHYVNIPRGMVRSIEPLEATGEMGA